MSGRSLMITLMGLSIAAVFGCSRIPSKAGPVSPEKARAALKTTLDAWQAGKTAESLAQESPAIIAQDLDWLQGKKLKSYKVLRDTEQDANLRVEVEIQLDGSDSPRKAVYIVGTDPKLTVFRALE